MPSSTIVGEPALPAPNRRNARSRGTSGVTKSIALQPAEPVGDELSASVDLSVQTSRLRLHSADGELN